MHKIKSIFISVSLYDVSFGPCKDSCILNVYLASSVFECQLYVWLSLRDKSSLVIDAKSMDQFKCKFRVGRVVMPSQLGN